MIYLYVKTHNKTHLKYFGKTISSDYHSYKGSGKYWNIHCRKHGYDYTTELIAMYDNSCHDEAKKFALDFSNKNNISKSKEWANLKEECLDGGFDHVNNENKKYYMEKARITNQNKSAEETKLINKKKARKGEKNGMFGADRKGVNNPRYGAEVTQETRNKISKANKGKHVVKDQDGNVIGAIDINHINIKNGTWISINKGSKRTEEFKKERSKQWKEKNRKPPSPKGMLWWNNGIICKRSKNIPGEGFVRGRI